MKKLPKILIGILLWIIIVYIALNIATYIITCLWANITCSDKHWKLLFMPNDSSVTIRHYCDTHS
jgi:hypothetical protein